MSEKSIVFNAALIEDPLRNSQISRPSNHSHHVAIHPKRNESIWSQIWATRDALYDPHNDAVNLIKATLKGAVLGAFFGTTLSILFKNHPTFVLRKAMRYIYNTNYGSAM